MSASFIRFLILTMTDTHYGRLITKKEARTFILEVTFNFYLSFTDGVFDLMQNFEKIFIQFYL